MKQMIQLRIAYCQPNKPKIKKKKTKLTKSFYFNYMKASVPVKSLKRFSCLSIFPRQQENEVIGINRGK